jgi:hypothetical protein
MDRRLPGNVRIFLDPWRGVAWTFTGEAQKVRLTMRSICLFKGNSSGLPTQGAEGSRQRAEGRGQRAEVGVRRSEVTKPSYKPSPGGRGKRLLSWNPDNRAGEDRSDIQCPRLIITDHVAWANQWTTSHHRHTGASWRGKPLQTTRVVRQ